MRRFRVLFIVLGVVFGLGAIGGGLAFYLTSGATEAADTFLRAYATGGPAAAYALAAPAFRNQIPEARLAAVGKGLSLNLYRESHWSSRSVSGGTAELDGTVSTTDGGAVPLHMELVKTDSGWQVLGLRTPHANDDARETPAAPPPPIPEGAALKQLTQVTMQRLAEAIVTGNFLGVQASAPRIVRDQITPERLRDNFKYFIDNHVDLTRVSYTDPVFDAPPRLDDNGQLLTKGHFDASPHPWYFDFKYVTDEGQWASTSIGISAKPE